MATVDTLVRALPWALCGRLTTAFVEIVLAFAVVSTSIVLGHELRDWRTWYADTAHPWAPTRAPIVSPIAEPLP